MSCDEYCPAPGFDLGLDEIFGTSIDKEVERPAAASDQHQPPCVSVITPIDFTETSSDDQEGNTL